ncbi:hypothetical protein [Sediminibacterium soli]|uniref:hypothetical protein n=1 Tax=Sediminibacterium soli TaxID=2698829 RepID=UPI00137A7AF7|nr:hypothetical protein [Sediminibacterium soli]NCI45972.1 hypothetical protein [Sediminibacterium soli]
MADRSFEEQVRRELEELRMQPDSQVWEDVSAALSKEKKRFGVLWILVLLMAAGGTWLFFDRQILPVNRPTAAGQQPGVQTNIPATAPAVKPVMKTPVSDSLSTHHHALPLQATVAANMPHTIAHTSAPAGKRTVAGSQTILPGRPVTGITAADETAAPKPVPVQPTTAKTADLTDAEKTSTTVTPAAQASQMQPGEIPAKTVVENKDSVIAGAAEKKTSITQKKRRPWSWHISADLGMAGIAERAPAADSANYASPAPGGNGLYNPGSVNNTAAISYKLPTEKNGVYLALQVHATRYLGKGSEMGLHIGYAQYANSTGIGRRLNTQSNLLANTAFDSRSDNGYAYLSTDSATYTNRYHFLLFGADYYRALVKNDSWSLRLRLGAAGGILLASNALYFDKNAGVLYRNNAILSKTQVQLSAGLDIGLGKQPVWYLGPQVGYVLSKTNDASPGKHLWNAAVRLTAVLPRKK